MSTPRIDSAIERSVRATPARHIINPQRARQVIQFCAIGATGALLDVLVTVTMLGQTHYLLANALGFTLAVSFNFAGNYYVTFNEPEGHLVWQYTSYVGLHSGTFAVRALVVAALVETSGVPAGPASAVGIVAASVVNYLGSERIFGGDGRVWFDAVDAINHFAHVCYHSRARRFARSIGVYGIAYRAYQVGLATLYQSERRQIAAGTATGTVHTSAAPEIVSVLHTLEKERDILTRFIADLRPDDEVWDVGANLGVFTVLAADSADSVMAFEPHMQTADRASHNLRVSGVVDSGTVLSLALGGVDGETRLAVERDEVGTQTPTTAADGDVTVPVRRGDSVAAELGQPDVIKIDVEGAEMDVLDGLAETLAETRLIYVETHDATFHDSDSRAVRERLKSHGFAVERVETGSQTYYRGERG